MAGLPHSERIIVHCQEPIPAGQPVSVRLSGRRRRLRIRPESCRPNPEGGYLVVAELLDRDFPVRPQNGQRKSARVRERIRAMGPELPSYRAVTVDCSEGGVLLETDAPLVPGQVLSLTLALLDHGPDLPCQVEVKWCEPAGEKTYRSGCAFRTAAPDFVRELRSVLARHPEYGRKRRFRSYAQKRTFKPLATEVPTPLSTTEVMTAPPAPIPLHTEPVPVTEESAPLDGTVVGFEAREDTVRITLELAEGKVEEVELNHVVTLSDHRGRAGRQVAYLALKESPGRARLRFLNAWREKVLEIETRRGYAWSA